MCCLGEGEEDGRTPRGLRVAHLPPGPGGAGGPLLGGGLLDPGLGEGQVHPLRGYVRQLDRKGIKALRVLCVCVCVCVCACVRLGERSRAHESKGMGDDREWAAHRNTQRTLASRTKPARTDITACMLAARSRSGSVASSALVSRDTRTTSKYGS
jgi:hypothetical protein